MHNGKIEGCVFCEQCLDVDCLVVLVIAVQIYERTCATALVGQGLLIIEASRSHSLDTPHSVGLFWTSDQPDARTSTCITHNIHKRQTSMPPEGFEPTIQTSERPQTHVLDRAATGFGRTKNNVNRHAGIRDYKVRLMQV
jgi:hypothetical protein